MQRSESEGEIPVSQVDELMKTGQMDKWTKGQKIVTVFKLLSCSFSRNGGKHHEFVPAEHDYECVQIMSGKWKWVLARLGRQRGRKKIQKLKNKFTED